jgi:hypothetical protein
VTGSQTIGSEVLWTWNYPGRPLVNSRWTVWCPVCVRCVIGPLHDCQPGGQSSTAIQEGF